MYISGKKIVVPLAGTWIETISAGTMTFLALVVPLAGTWIETFLR